MVFSFLHLIHASLTLSPKPNSLVFTLDGTFFLCKKPKELYGIFVFMRGIIYNVLFTELNYDV